MSENCQSNDRERDNISNSLSDFGFIPELTWRAKANRNINKWGLQTFKELLLAMQEEMGELTKAYLEREYEDGDLSSIEDELDDLMALGYQLRFKIIEEASKDYG